MKPSELREAQREYKMAKSENDYFMKRAKESNREAYKKLDETEDKEEIKSLKADIFRINNESGLYNSYSRLSVAECQLFRAAREEIKEYCRKNKQMDLFDYLDQSIFRSKQLKTNAIRRKRLIEICLNAKPGELAQVEL